MSTMKKRLIVTADDFGYSHKRNLGVVESFLAGGVTRASLMVNAEAFQDAVKLAQQHSIPLGLHLNLTEGYPLSPKEDVFTLLDANGLMLGKTGFRDAIRDGFIDLREVALEMHAQIKRFNEVCEKMPLYIDGHQHIHVLPAISSVFATVLEEHGITEIRLPVELGIEHCDWLKQNERELYDSIIFQAKEAAPVFQSKGIRYTDGFVGMVTMGYNLTIERLTSCLRETFKCAQYSVQTHAAYPRANYTSTRSIAQGSHTPYDCDTKGCESSQEDSIQARQDSATVDIKPAKESGDENVGSKQADAVGIDDGNKKVSGEEPLVVTVEFMVHPGYPSEPGDLGCGTGADEFACSPGRKYELDIITCKELLDWYRKEEIALVSSCSE